MERRHTNLIFRGRNRPIRIAFIYMICGLAWVGVSDWVLGILPAHSVDLNRLVFVAVNAVILYVVASRYAARIQLRVTAEREIAARSRGYFESSVEGIVSIDQQGIIRQANPRALEMFGYSDIELVGHPIEVLIPNRIRERHLVHRASFFANPRSRRMGQGLEVIARRKDGSEFPAEVSLNFVQTERGDLVVGFVSDITERRAMEREGRRSETLSALGALAAGIAHELNNPLAVVSSRIDLMLERGRELPAEIREDLMVLQRHVERTSRISRNLLALARQRPGTRQPLNLNDAVEDAITLVNGDNSDNAVSVDLALTSGLPLVMGDPTGLEQVLINLVMNAREARARRIRIESGHAPDRPGFLRVTVADDGTGIDPETRAHLFEAFLTTKPKGTGLGLWMSHRIVQEHGGSLEAHDEPGGGARFVITLPAMAAAASEGPRPQ